MKPILTNTFRRFLFVFIILIEFSNSSLTWAQKKDSVDVCQFVGVYDFLTNTKDKNGNAVKDSVQLATLVGKNIAKCMEFNRTMMEDFGEGSVKDYQYGEWYSRKYNLPVWFVNYPEGEISAFDKIVPNRFLINEKIPDFHWRLTDDTLTVSGYLCHKAIGSYAGRTWYAWYAEDIATSFGPWKLQGLPGMILRAEDSKGIFLFSCTGLLQRKAKIKYFNTKGYNVVKRDKFISQRNKLLCSKKYVQNPRYYIPKGTFEQLRIAEMWPGGPEPPAEEKLSIVATDMIIPKKANTYQPLELK